MHATPTRLLAVLLAGLLAPAAFAACDAPLHLSPTGPSGSSSSSGGGVSGCRSNADCAFPQAVCDTVAGKCVGCLTAADCAYEPGAVCSKGQCECPPGGQCGNAGAGASSASSTSGTGGAGTGGGGTGGAGTGGAGGADGGSDAPHDAAPEAAACVQRCNQALNQGGPVCPGTTSFNDYANLKKCAGCMAGPLLCGTACATSICTDLPMDGMCKVCLQQQACIQPLSACQLN